MGQFPFVNYYPNPSISGGSYSRFTQDRLLWCFWLTQNIHVDLKKQRPYSQMLGL